MIKIIKPSLCAGVSVSGRNSKAAFNRALIMACVMADARDEAKDARERVPSEPEVPRVALAQCPNCGNLYDGCGLRFLYSEEYGSYCPSCGACLVEAPGISEEEVTRRCHLIIPKVLKGRACTVVLRNWTTNTEDSAAQRKADVRR